MKFSYAPNFSRDLQDQEDQNLVAEEDKDRKSGFFKRYFLTCSPHCWTAWISVLIVMLGLSALIFYILFNRIPSVGRSTAAIDNSGSAPVMINFDSSPIQITFKLLVSAEVTSYSYITLYADKVNVQVFANIPQGSDRPKVGDSIVDSVSLPPRQTSVVKASTSLKLNGAIDDPVIKTIYTSCLNKQKLSFHFIAFVDYLFIKNYKAMEQDYELDCPLDLNSLLSSGLGGLSQTSNGAIGSLINSVQSSLPNVPSSSNIPSVPPISAPNIPITLPPAVPQIPGL